MNASKKKKALALMLAACCLLGGCAAKDAPQDALPAATETGVAQVDIPSGTGGSRVETREVALYFRAQGEDLLARETRKR